MEITPIAPEWYGSPKVMFIIDNKLNTLNDLTQYPVIGVTRARFTSLIEKYTKSYYLTLLIKCITKNQTYKAEEIKECIKWIEYEIDIVKPDIIIGCGSSIKKYIKCDYNILSPSKIIENKKNEEKFELILRKVFNGNKS